MECTMVISFHSESIKANASRHTESKDSLNSAQTCTVDHVMKCRYFTVIHILTPFFQLSEAVFLLLLLCFCFVGAADADINWKCVLFCCSAMSAIISQMTAECCPGHSDVECFSKLWWMVPRTHQRACAAATWSWTSVHVTFFALIIFFTLKPVTVYDTGTQYGINWHFLQTLIHLLSILHNRWNAVIFIH